LYQIKRWQWMISESCWREWLWPILRYYVSICLKRQKKTMKNKLG
jgi:hypothetical protein